MQRDELLWVAAETFFPKKKDLISLLDLPRNFPDEDKEKLQRDALVTAREWLIHYSLYSPQTIDKEFSNNLWFKDPRSYEWPNLGAIKYKTPPDAGKKVCFLSHLLGASPSKTENILSNNIFNPRKTEHLWIMGLLNIMEDRNPDLSILLYSLRTKQSVEAGWIRMKKNLESHRVDIWDFTFFTSIFSQYHHKRDLIDVRANKGRAYSRLDTPRSIAALDNLTLNKTSIIRIIEWLSLTRLDTIKKETLIKGLLENFLLQTHLKPHLPHRGRSSSKIKRQEQALCMLNEARDILKIISSKFPYIDLSPHLAKIENMTRHAERSKEPSSEVELRLAESHPHFKVFYYLYEAYRGEQREKWGDWLKEAYQLLHEDAEGLVMYGPLLDSRRQQLKEAIA